MNKNILIDDFLKPVKLEQPITEMDYINIQPQIESFIALARIANLSIFIVDYNKRDFLYVSSHPLFLCGYDREEVKKMGLEFYLKVVSEEDLSMLHKINKAGFDYYYTQPLETRGDLILSYDLKIRHLNSHKYIINNKITPFVITKEGHIWLSLGLVTLSTRENSGSVYIQHINSSKRIEYSFETKRWKPSLSVSLTERERNILQLTAQGYTQKEIAIELFIDESTVKYHKTNILNKLGVVNIMEAVYFATVNSMI